MSEKEPLMQVSFRIPRRNQIILKVLEKEAKLSIPGALEPVIVDYAESRRQYSIERMTLLLAHLNDGREFPAPSIDYPHIAQEDVKQVGIMLPLSSYLVLKSIDCTDGVSVARQVEPVVIDFTEQNAARSVEFVRSWFPNNNQL
jgi:hypothetical protein